MNNYISITAARRQGYETYWEQFKSVLFLHGEIEQYHVAEIKGIPVNYRRQKQLDCLTVFLTDDVAVRKTPKGNFILFNVNTGNAEEFKAISTTRIKLLVKKLTPVGEKLFGKCCAKERRGINGGCKNCGDPSY